MLAPPVGEMRVSTYAMALSRPTGTWYSRPAESNAGSSALVPRAGGSAGALLDDSTPDGARSKPAITGASDFMGARVIKICAAGRVAGVRRATLPRGDFTRERAPLEATPRGDSRCAAIA